MHPHRTWNPTKIVALPEDDTDEEHETDEEDDTDGEHNTNEEHETDEELDACPATEDKLEIKLEDKL